MAMFRYKYLTFSEEQLEPIEKEIDEIIKELGVRETYNYTLAGHINHQYELTKCKKHVEEFLIQHVYDFDKETFYTKNLGFWKEAPKLYLDALWVNIQAKHEFNPVHDHSGLFSFVCWLKVPFNIQDELALYPKPFHRCEAQTGHFCFHHLDEYGQIVHERLPVDRSWEKMAIIFPAKANHSVNPFYTSDEYRISISGNFFPV